MASADGLRDGAGSASGHVGAISGGLIHGTEEFLGDAAIAVGTFERVDVTELGPKSLGTELEEQKAHHHRDEARDGAGIRPSRERNEEATRPALPHVVEERQANGAGKLLFFLVRTAFPAFRKRARRRRYDLRKDVLARNAFVGRHVDVGAESSKANRVDCA